VKKYDVCVIVIKLFGDMCEEMFIVKSEKTPPSVERHAVLGVAWCGILPLDDIHSQFSTNEERGI